MSYPSRRDHAQSINHFWPDVREKVVALTPRHPGFFSAFCYRTLQSHGWTIIPHQWSQRVEWGVPCNDVNNCVHRHRWAGAFGAGPLKKDILSTALEKIGNTDRCIGSKIRNSTSSSDLLATTRTWYLMKMQVVKLHISQSVDPWSWCSNSESSSPERCQFLLHAFCNPRNKPPCALVLPCTLLSFGTRQSLLLH